MREKNKILRVSEQLKFYTGTMQCNFPIVVITGACRSGKTLLTNLLATCKEAEAVDEPWNTMMLPMVAGTNLINTELASTWFAAGITELFNDIILLRQANFRPTDLSSIWSKKDPQTIFQRISNLQSRNDVKTFAKANNLTLLITLAECAPFIDYIIRFIPHAKIIHVIRDAFDVACDIQAKGWLNDKQLNSPINAQLYRIVKYKGLEWYLPWWVEDADYEWFICASEYSRSLYYWCEMMDGAADAFDRVENDSITIGYENLVANTHYEFSRILKYAKLTESLMTEKSIQDIKPIPRSFASQNISSKLCNRIEQIKLFWKGRV